MLNEAIISYGVNQPQSIFLHHLVYDRTMQDIKQTALNLLSFRDHSRLELRQKLTKKGFDSAKITLVLDYLDEQKLLNDLNFAENYTYFRKQKGYGPLRITQELQNKGISSDIIAEVIDITDNEWQTMARQTWLKRFNGQPGSNIKEKARQMRYLQYRGFTQAQINDALEQI